MNTNVKTELAAVAATQSAVDAMAVVTLSPEKYAAEVYEPFKARLATAIDSVRAIDYDITTTVGMATAVKCRALFRDMRVAADKERKARKEPITKIGKLLESGFDLVEERITPLELMFDADIDSENLRKDAEKAAKIAAERARTEAIEARIQAIRNAPLAMVGKSSADIQAACDAIRDTIITEELFGEQSYRDKAMEARSDAFNALEAAFDVAAKAEAAALAAEQARVAEAARIEAERAELARQRAENERIANEQAVERQRLANLAAAQEAESRRISEQAAANLRAERAALDEQQAAIAAERKALDDKIEAEKIVRELALQLEADHAEALIDNATFDDAMARLAAVDTPVFSEPSDDLARCNATVATARADAADPVDFSLAAYSDAGLDTAFDESPTDQEIIDCYCENFGGTPEQAFARIAKMVSQPECK